jgi:putative N-acetylmannosamine-6-phosphate epimerase
MAQYTEASVKTYTSGAALAQHLRVTYSSGKLGLADASTLEIGTMERPAYAADQDAPVRLRNAPGTCIMIANSAIALGAAVYAAAGGKVDNTGTVLLGYAESAAAADDDEIEVLRV